MSQQDFDEAIDEWDDILEEAPPTSEVEEGSELDQAIHRKAPPPKESGIVPPHGPRAYKKVSSNPAKSAVADVSTDEVLFDDGADWRAQPTMRIVLEPEGALAPPTVPSPAAPDETPSRAILIGTLVLGVLVVLGAALYASQQTRDAERLEQQIRMQLEASE